MNFRIFLIKTLEYNSHNKENKNRIIIYLT